MKVVIDVPEDVVGIGVTYIYGSAVQAEMYMDQKMYTKADMEVLQETKMYSDGVHGEGVMD